MEKFVENLFPFMEFRPILILFNFKRAYFELQNRLFCVPKPIVLCDKAIGKKKAFIIRWFLVEYKLVKISITFYTY